MLHTKKYPSLIKICITHIKSHYVNKDPNIWIFGAIRGEKYMDNAKYLFEYVNKQTSITAIWLSNSQPVLDHLKQKGYRAYSMHSSEAMSFALKAKVAVITHRGSNKKADLPFYAFTKKTKIIQLWHGMPLKKIAFDDKIYSFTHDESKLIYKIRERIKKAFFPFTQYVNQPSMVIALSEETRNIISQAFRIDKNKVVATGFPRNDFLTKMPEKKIESAKIIYAPTFRNIEGSEFNLFENYMFKTQEIDLFLGRHNIKLHIKLHPFNIPSQSTLQEIKKSKNILFLETDDIYQQLQTYSILITDYSSIYFDFLLTGKAIIFSPFDKETYLGEDREFYYNYDETMHGPQAKNWDEVLKLIEVFLTTPDYYQEKRNRAKKIFHNIKNNHYSENVCNEIKQLVIK